MASPGEGRTSRAASRSPRSAVLECSSFYEPFSKEHDHGTQDPLHHGTIYRDGWVCTVYEKSTRDVGFPAEPVLKAFGWQGAVPDVVYAGTEGELYDLRNDPLQWRNLWDDPSARSRRSDLVADLYDHLPPARSPALRVEAPA
jgi:hypothetical protein